MAALKLFRESRSVGGWLLKQSERNEWGAEQARIRNQEYQEKQQNYTVGNSLLKKRKMKTKPDVKEIKEETVSEIKEGPIWDKFRKVRWSLKRPNGKAIPFMTDVNIWEQIMQQSSHSIDIIYNYAFENFDRGDITADQWHAFENLIWNKGIPLELSGYN